MLTVDIASIASVEFALYAYGSTWPQPVVSAEVYVDNVVVRRLNEGNPDEQYGQ